MDRELDFPDAFHFHHHPLASCFDFDFHDPSSLVVDGVVVAAAYNWGEVNYPSSSGCSDFGAAVAAGSVAPLDFLASENLLAD